MVISSPRALHNPHGIFCRDACGNQRLIRGHTDAGMAKFARDSQLSDGLSRLILHGEAVQAWRLWDATMFRRTGLKLGWSCDAPPDNPMRFLLRTLRPGGTRAFPSLEALGTVAKRWE